MYTVPSHDIANIIDSSIFSFSNDCRQNGEEYISLSNFMYQTKSPLS